MDEAILRAINAWSRVPAIAAFAEFLSSPWMLIGVTAPLLVILLRKKKWIAIASIALAMGSADVINARIIKPMIARERPCRALQELSLPVKCGVGKSFASGHAAVAFAFALSASSTVRGGWLLFPFLALLVALSRVVLGVHYPFDIFAGGMIGGAIGSLLWLWRVRLERTRSPSHPRPDPPTPTEPSGLPP